MWTSLLLSICSPLLTQGDVDWAELAANFDGQGDRDRALVAWARGLVDHDTPEARRELARVAEGRAALRFTLHVPGVDDHYWPGTLLLGTAAGRIATGWDDVRIFDEHTGALVCEPLPVAPVQLALDPTGTHVAVIEVGDRAAVWDIANAQRKFELLPGWGPIAWAPNGALVARAVDGGDTWQVTVWDAVTGAVLHQPEPSAEGVNQLAFSSDGRYLAIAEGAVRVLDLQRGIVAVSGLGGDDYRIRFHPTAPRLMILDNDRAVMRAWDLEAGAWVGPELCGYAYPRQIERDPGGERWVVSQAERAVASFADTGAPAGGGLQTDDLTVSQAQYAWAAEDLSPDGRLQAVSGVGDTVRVWDTVTGHRLGPLLRHGRRVTGLEFTGAGALVTASADGVVRIWSTDELTPLEFVSHEVRCDDVLLAPSGPYALIMDELAEFEVREPNGEAFVRFDCSTRLTKLAVSADGACCAAIGADHGLWTWDLGDAAARPVQIARSARGHSLAIDARGARVVHGDRDHVVRLFDLGARAHVAHWPFPWGLDDFPIDHEGLVWGLQDERVGTLGSTSAPMYEPPGDDEQRPLAVDAHGEALLIGTEKGEQLEWRMSDRRSADLAALIALDAGPVRSWLVSGTRVVAIHARSATLIDPVHGTLVARIARDADIGLAQLIGDRLMLESWPTAWIYDSDDGTLLAAHELRGRVLALTPIPGCARLAISALRRELHVVNVTTGDRVGRALPLTEKPSALEIVDDDTAVLATVEGAVLVIDLSTGAAREVVASTGKEIMHVALSRDEERLVYVEAPDVVVLRDIALGVDLYRQRLTLQPDAVETTRRVSHSGSDPDEELAIQFDPTGRKLLVSGRLWARLGPGNWALVPARAEIVDAATGEVSCTLEGHDDWQTTFRQFSDDGERLIAWRWKELRTWATTSGKALASITLEDNIANARLQPDGSLVSVEDEHGGCSVWETDTGAVHLPRRHLGGTRYQDAALSPDGRLFFAPAADDKGHWLDLATGETLAIVDDPREIDFGPDGLVLLDRARLVRVSESGVQPIGFRPPVIGYESWSHFADGRDISFVDAQRVVVGVKCAEQRERPMSDEVELLVSDFGPARHEPLSGTPAELIERWSTRLGLHITPDGRIEETTRHELDKPR